MPPEEQHGFPHKYGLKNYLVTANTVAHTSVAIGPPISVVSRDLPKTFGPVNCDTLDLDLSVPLTHPKF